ncbi:hypothetical protein FK531_07045 [Rhodococcus spelaei]|uniref:DUF8020 domain-containing protein n=1 Tax=Rhodococcus spelaei TaxID=2546320 RepID=A0A541BLT0_9NOCA|nr:hypothetical protein [Rhodococcus spelaei]TQF73276.1 hypothetical protein FK531_07045 [Rhodococcus spelaei]
MKIKKLAATAAVVVAATGITAATAGAAPARTDRPDNSTVSADVLPGIHYKAALVDKSVVLTTDTGSLTVRGDQFQVLDGSGTLVAGVPLTYQRDGRQWPIAARIDGNTATLTPSTDPAVARPLENTWLPLRSIDATKDANFNQALTNFGAEVSLGVAIGSLIGTAVGAGIGCIAGGAILGAGATVATIGTLTVPGAIGGCLVTGAAAGAIGAVAGTILVGGPVAIVSGIQFANDLNTPPAPAPAG